MQWQGEEDTILAGQDSDSNNGIELRSNIAVTQRNTFGRSRCSGCIKQHCFVVAAHRREFYLLALKEPLPIRLRRIVFAGIEQDEPWFFF